MGSVGEQPRALTGVVPEVSAVLVLTKLRPPPRSERLVPRTRLIDALSRDPLPKVTLVDAPAGWGKTTLILDWLSADRELRRFAWLALDAGDNDTARFWTYVVESLRTVEPALGEQALSALQVPGMNVTAFVLPTLLNELQDLGEPIVLVLDDYHSVTNREIHQSMAALVAHIPPTLRLVVASRQDPPLPLPALRARRELAEIRADALSFRLEEAGLLLNDVLGLDLASADVSRLRERTEGWAAGLCLAALSLDGRPDAGRFIEEFAGDDRHVVGYLGEEVLGLQPEDVRNFLLRTSILDRLSAPLCDAVTQADCSAEMLERVERANVFLIPLDEKRHWYRYHQLFADLLRLEMGLGQREPVEELHRRASAWLRQNGFISEAIRHATAAGDYEEAADLIADQWSAFLQRGELGTVGHWLDALPPDTVLSDPRLCLTRAWVAVNQGGVAEIDRWIEAAEQAAKGFGEEDAPTYEAAAGMLRCIHRYMEGDVGGAIEVARRARELEPFELAPWRSVGCPVMGIALFWQGDHRRAVDTLDGAIERARRSGNHLAVIHGNSCLAAIHAEQGKAAEAANFAETALRLGHEHGLADHWATTMAHVASARVLEHEGRLEDARVETEQAVELSRRGVVLGEISYALLAHARTRHSAGDVDGARRLVAEARQTIEACRDPGILAELLAAAERSMRTPHRTRRPLSERDELTNRELAVLRLLPTDLTLAEIARSLYLSRNTVKTHARSIYRKLDVATREAAVASARELGLL
jgi:LuxR family maltose regulon positive regulatory protein